MESGDGRKEEEGYDFRSPTKISFILLLLIFLLFIQAFYGYVQYTTKKPPDDLDEPTTLIRYTVTDDYNHQEIQGRVVDREIINRYALTDDLPNGLYYLYPIVLKWPDGGEYIGVIYTDGAYKRYYLFTNITDCHWYSINSSILKVQSLGMDGKVLEVRHIEHDDAMYLWENNNSILMVSTESKDELFEEMRKFFINRFPPTDNINYTVY